MGALFAVVATTLTVSALCSLFEATLYSTRIASLEAARDQGRNLASAEHLLRLKRHIGVPTSAILILNTIANTAGATVAGMLAADALGIEWIPLFSGLLTLAILLFSEILPKTFGATHWKVLWPFVVWPLLFLEKALRPLIWLTQAFSSIFISKQGAPVTTEDEIVAMIRMGAHSGELTATELELLTAVFRFDNAQAKDVMFPRREVIVFDTSWDLARCLAIATKTQHTRYPLCDGSLDNLVGLVHVKDLLRHFGQAQVDLRAIARPLRRIPDTMPARTILQEMQQTSQPHMVAVVDEHGTVIGLVTHENLVEQLVGSVADEFDHEEPEFQREDDETFFVRGSISLARLSAELDLNLNHEDATTLSGVVVAQLGRLPAVGDRTQVGGLKVEVITVRHDRAEHLRLSTDEDDAPQNVG